MCWLGACARNKLIGWTIGWTEAANIPTILLLVSFNPFQWLQTFEEIYRNDHYHLMIISESSYNLFYYELNELNAFVKHNQYFLLHQLIVK
jgi:hypothetical protein